MTSHSKVYRTNYLRNRAIVVVVVYVVVDMVVVVLTPITAPTYYRQRQKQDRTRLNVHFSQYDKLYLSVFHEIHVADDAPPRFLGAGGSSKKIRTTKIRR